ncbi:MAG: UbiH/UbiF/VisC/COQ6 family ubiquinone biosynthesis hydroxylase [Pseudomonadales bacterium]|nr:UbiH/UbiF/VisC/COQ6 family ubiquinone biosynthesis hydroxylase [Pseudomonadales bacterium]MCP5190139.1 UbiH/UbiF/VisC/COQ6 family ubiquinone biosynthesis hydroxylase [Pseudomonadales bacterium]
MPRGWRPWTIAGERIPVADGQAFDVVIVGAGIAGSALAVALAGHDLTVALVEAQPLVPPSLPAAVDVGSFDPRVSALTPRSRQLLQELGAWEAIAAYRQCPYTHMTVWDADGTGCIEFDCAEVGAPALGHIVENRAIVSALLQSVERAADITAFGGVGLQDCRRDQSAQLMQLQLADGTALRAGLLVAADGALSRVREMLAFRTREWDYGHRAIVTTVQVERSHGGTARQRFLPSGPLAFLPLPGAAGAHYCSIVWSLRDELVDDLLALDERAFCVALGDAFENRLGEVQACAPRYAFPLRQRHAVDYIQPGVALVADAAHTIHPLAGQGINLGLQDVAVLAEEVLAGRARGSNPGQAEILRRYQRRRKGDNLVMMAAMDGFKRLFEQQALPVRWLRNAGMRGVGRLKPLKQQLIRHAMGVQ